MELLKDLKLVAVEYENEGAKAVLTYLDEDRGEIRTINFNRQSYKDGQFVDDSEKAEKVDEWCKKYFNLSYKDLTKAIGTKMDVYAYDSFNSLWEVEQVEKYTEDMVGQIYQTNIKEIVVDDYFIKIRFDIDGKTYESKQTYGKYMEDMKQWFKDPIKKEKEFTKFKEKYGVSVDDKDQLVGHDIIVEVKKAFGKYMYGEIKPFPKSSKK